MLSTLNDKVKVWVKMDFAENYDVPVNQVVLVDARLPEQHDFAHYDSHGLTLEQIQSRCLMVEVDYDSDGTVEVLIDREWYLSNYRSKLCLTDYSAR